MGLSIDSKLKDILANPGGVEVLEKIQPGCTSDPAFKLFGGLALKRVKDMSRGKITDAELAEADAALRALGD